MYYPSGEESWGTWTDTTASHPPPWCGCLCTQAQQVGLSGIPRPEVCSKEAGRAAWGGAAETPPLPPPPRPRAPSLAALLDSFTWVAAMAAPSPVPLAQTAVGTVLLGILPAMSAVTKCRDRETCSHSSKALPHRDSPFLFACPPAQPRETQAVLGLFPPHTFGAKSDIKRWSERC